MSRSSAHWTVHAPRPEVHPSTSAGKVQGGDTSRLAGIATATRASRF
jgi:hypothetical protein